MTAAPQYICLAVDHLYILIITNVKLTSRVLWQHEPRTVGVTAVDLCVSCPHMLLPSRVALFDFFFCSPQLDLGKVTAVVVVAVGSMHHFVLRHFFDVQQ